jgi:hypothetical protein
VVERSSLTSVRKNLIPRPRIRRPPASRRPVVDVSRLKGHPRSQHHDRYVCDGRECTVTPHHEYDEPQHTDALKIVGTPRHGGSITAGSSCCEQARRKTPWAGTTGHCARSICATCTYGPAASNAVERSSRLPTSDDGVGVRVWHGPPTNTARNVGPRPGIGVGHQDPVRHDHGSDLSTYE